MIAFFGHNVNDSAIHRRAAAFQRAGYDIVGYMPRRGTAKPTPWKYVDLGETYDGAYRHRISSIRSGAEIALQHASDLKKATLIYARNLDMLALALRVRRKLGLKTPVVYECLDVHHRLSGGSLAARILRRFERALLKQTSLVVISSPRFDTEHFSKFYPGLCTTFLVENRLVESPALPERPVLDMVPEDRPLRIGWFGNLRCRHSLDLLLNLAKAFPAEISVILRGYPAQSQIPDLEGDIAGFPNVVYRGRYEAPGDLKGIYGEVDLVWAGDWYEYEANSVWLLPNRIYEGGYFATPALAPLGTETARWISENGAGILLDDPVEVSFGREIGRLLDNRAYITNLKEQLLKRPRHLFVEDADLMDRLVKAAVAGQATSSIYHDIGATGPGAETGR